MPSGSFHEGVKELDGSLGASLSLMVILEGERENEKGRMIIIFWIDRLEWKHQQLTDYLVSILLHCIWPLRALHFATAYNIAFTLPVSAIKFEQMSRELIFDYKKI